jgi:hypothetical protein
MTWRIARAGAFQLSFEGSSSARNVIVCVLVGVESVSVPASVASILTSPRTELYGVC